MQDTLKTFKYTRTLTLLASLLACFLIPLSVNAKDGRILAYSDNAREAIAIGADSQYIKFYSCPIETNLASIKLKIETSPCKQLGQSIPQNDQAIKIFDDNLGPYFKRNLTNEILKDTALSALERGAVGLAIGAGLGVVTAVAAHLMTSIFDMTMQLAFRAPAEEGAASVLPGIILRATAAGAAIGILGDLGYSLLSGKFNIDTAQTNSIETELRNYVQRDPNTQILATDAFLRSLSVDIFKALAAAIIDASYDATGGA